MMPRTHFMIGALSVALLSFFFEISLLKVFVGGVIGSIVDIDHFFAYMKRHGKFNVSETMKLAVKHLEHERTPYIHGPFGVIMFFVLASALYAFHSLEFALILLLPYLLHLVFDFVPYNATFEKFYKFGHYLIPVTFEELIVDIFVFDMLLIALIHFGIIV